MKNSGRNKAMDIIKAVACMGVYVHHFLLAFFPAVYYGTSVPSRMYGGFDYVLASEPIGVLTNGNFWVMVFLLIASFFQAKHVIERGLNFGIDTLKRYLRLLIPIIPIAIINFIIRYVMQVTEYIYRGPDLEYNFFGMLWHLFVVQWVKSDGSVLGPLWMIYALFLGSLLAMILGKVTSKTSHSSRSWFCMVVIYLLLIAAALKYDQVFVSVILGVLLADVVCFDRCGIISRIKKTDKKVIFLIGIIITILGLYLGGYPSYAAPGRFYNFLPGTGIMSFYYITVHSVAALLFVAGINMIFAARQESDVPAFAGTASAAGVSDSGSATQPAPESASKSRLGSCIIDFWSEHGYVIYLIHIVWIDAVSYGLYNLLLSFGIGYTTTGIIVFIIITACVTASAALYRKFEKKSLNFVAKIRPRKA